MGFLKEIFRTCLLNSQMMNTKLHSSLSWPDTCPGIFTGVAHFVEVVTDEV